MTPSFAFRRAASVAHVRRSRGRFATAGILSLLPVLVAAAQTRGAGPSPCPEHLFTVERSKNANVVVYDANRGPAGDLVASEPVVAYWLLKADRGQRAELNAIERERAYGFDVAPGKEPGTFVMTFRAGSQRRPLILVRDGCPAAMLSIGGRESVLRKIFIKSKEKKRRLPTVDYVEFFGEDAATGKALHEKLEPGK